MYCNAVRLAIAELSRTRRPTIDKVAEVLGVSVRSLQRRLNEDGHTFSELVEAVRFDRACRLLKGPRMRVTDVAAALGYADHSSFSRAFMRWSGMPPRAYRHHQRSAGDRHHERALSNCN